MMSPELRETLRAACGEALRFDAPGSGLTSLRVGGPVDALATPADRRALAALLALCRRHDIPCHVIGRGFNTILRDGGVAGVVIRLSRFRRLEKQGDGTLLVEAGVSHAGLSHYCREHGLSGLEFLAGIPGSLGGWIAMNAGVPGFEIGDCVSEVELMRPEDQRLQWCDAGRLGFRYRGADGLAPGEIVCAARLGTRPAAPEAVAQKIYEQLERRAKTQPVNRPSCGSVFKNPPQQFAGALIEAAGLSGRRCGGARISELHANFIINEGDASAADVLELIAAAREAVERQSGIRLEEEVRVWGREG